MQGWFKKFLGLGQQRGTSGTIVASTLIDSSPDLGMDIYTYKACGVLAESGWEVDWRERFVLFGENSEKFSDAKESSGDAVVFRVANSDYGGSLTFRSGTHTLHLCVLAHEGQVAWVGVAHYPSTDAVQENALNHAVSALRDLLDGANTQSYESDPSAGWCIVSASEIHNPRSILVEWIPDRVPSFVPQAHSPRTVPSPGSPKRPLITVWVEKRVDAEQMVSDPSGYRPHLRALLARLRNSSDLSHERAAEIMVAAEHGRYEIAPSTQSDGARGFDLIIY